MSTSRLEKFIYAICSMEVTDLPVPLSRIETLWNCLITGETPDFEPLSRNEKYLMAMLDRYDISNLPAPMSRGEKLLYKIAVGETDLSDIPAYLSRYEELLGYLAENGGVGDFEYVLYTLNQRLSTLYSTKERPVKSAILKGQTLVNMVTDNTTNGYTLEQDGSSIKNARVNLIDGFENDIYTIIFEISNMNIVNPNGNWIVYINAQTKADSGADNTSIKSFIKNGRVSFTYKPSREQKTTNWFNICLHIDSGVGSTITIKNVVVLKGDHTQEDIPYFEGMQSVKMPVLKTVGKNLFGVKDKVRSGEYFYQSSYIYVPVDKGVINSVNTTTISVEGTNATGLYCLLTVKPYYSATYEAILVNAYGEFSHSKPIRPQSFIHGAAVEQQYYLSFGFDGGTETDVKNYLLSSDINVQIEEGSTATPYEPYKSNILTVNEEVELRGIGDVKDTLDGNTGELTQRIGEIVIDENNDIRKESYCENVDEGFFKFITEYVEKPKNNNYISNKLQKINVYELTNAVGFTLIGGKGKYRYLFCIKSSELSELSLNGCKQWLAKNPITIQYQLATESIKTVDLTTVDQDGQPTKLKTFNDITHVEIKADNLIPSVDLEVATKISETLSTMGLEHHDISETQNKLGQTIDEQAENTDATMMATTEIYEQTL